MDNGKSIDIEDASRADNSGTGIANINEVDNSSMVSIADVDKVGR